MAFKTTIYRVHLKRPDLPQYRRKNPTYVSAVSRRKVTFYTNSEYNSLLNKRLQRKKEFNATKNRISNNLNSSTFDFSNTFSIFALVIFFLLIAMVIRNFTDGSIPTFKGLLEYLSSITKPTIPFQDTGSGIFDFLSFVFSNAIQGFEIFMGFVNYLLIG